jgi:hypothetical protein
MNGRQSRAAQAAVAQGFDQANDTPGDDTTSVGASADLPANHKPNPSDVRARQLSEMVTQISEHARERMSETRNASDDVMAAIAHEEAAILERISLFQANVAALLEAEVVIRESLINVRKTFRPPTVIAGQAGQA